MDALTGFLSRLIAARWTFEAVGAHIDILWILEKQEGTSLLIRESYVQTFDIDLPFTCVPWLVVSSCSC